MKCLVDGCERERKIQGYCQKHYAWGRRHGKIKRLTPRPEKFSLTARFPKDYRVNANGCWIWKRTIDVHGYGVIVDEQGRNGKAHRFSYELHKGKVPNELHVLHKCDVRSCVNPDHLFLGTDADNIHDCVAKGRHAFGNRNGRRKLCLEDVITIRSEYAKGGVRQAELARQYGVDPSCISVIISHVNWKQAR